MKRLTASILFALLLLTPATQSWGAGEDDARPVPRIAVQETQGHGGQDGDGDITEAVGVLSSQAAWGDDPNNCSGFLCFPRYILALF